MNILYIGSSGALSITPFKKLLSSAYSIAAVGIFNPVIIENKVIALDKNSLALNANQNKIPLIDLSQDVTAIIKQCKSYSIDIILMSCYGKRLPEEIATLPSMGCFNMHPSLLPQYRGPEPIFWQMKEGSEKGVSWHHVTNEFDGGDVVKKKAVNFDDGADYATINRQIADIGSNLMIDFLAEISKDMLQSSKQNVEDTSYQHYPVASDFVVDTQWSAQHAYNFMRATEIFNYPYFCSIGIHNYLLDKAVDYDNNDSLQVAEVQGNELNIPFNGGVLTATFFDKL